MAQCPTGALQAAGLAQGDWRQWAEINASCVEGGGVACGICLDPCPEQAISRSHQGQLTIDPGLCSGCGACYGVCPVGAIALNQLRVAESPVFPNELGQDAEESQGYSK